MENIVAAIGLGTKRFIGLSRMTHSILDIAHPLIGAILVCGTFPKMSIIAIGLLAAFAGFTAVFALNDVMDARVDAEKMARYRKNTEAFDLDSVGSRHPIAQGILSQDAAIAWVVSWGLLALLLAFVLNPLCPVLLLAAIALEMVYCRLLRITHWKTLLSGVMVALGGLAGVYAVTDSPSPLFVALFFLWAFAWEIGGRNIPNDWSDIDEDKELGIRTVPLKYGRLISSHISLALMVLTVVASMLFPLVVPVQHPLLYLVGALASGILLLVLPGLLWVKEQSVESGMRLFNSACFYPIAVCACIIVVLVL